MTSRSSDVVVVGCGAAGLAVAAALARRGRRVIGLEQFDVGHARGSSHGTERIVRVAYVDAVHARMAAASLQGWRQLEVESNSTLVTETGGIDIGTPSEIDLLATRCEEVGVRVERLDVADTEQRFPMFRFDARTAEGDRQVMYHSVASTVHAERALRALRTISERHGAHIVTGSCVTAIEPIADDAVVVHHDGGTVTASTCVVAAGGWGGSPLVLASLGGDARLPPLRVSREQAGFYRPSTEGRWPTFVDRSDPSVYGLPTPDGLVKVGEHHTGPVIDVDANSDELEPTTWHRLQRWVADHLPGVDPTPLRTATCLYASFPGDTFLFDRVGPVVVGLGLSGHGFKFVPEIGRRLADLADRIDDAGNPFSFERRPIDVGASGQR